ncbi:hypothetical protein HNP48_006159 [Acidovorax soli]|uniref:Uncharacterized protein n=1 Tax=Acidovorax soli TaxID=592050 RepID=A0A7X0PKH4_9BURK|nr:hypothetical protein [Acidovorax soli]MBB6563439.1 hypothetical protein [Acidovorax soli]
MTERLSLVLWSWYAEDEYKNILALCELCQALEFLASSAEEQAHNIPNCQACEAWYSVILPVNNYLESCPQAVGPDVRHALARTWESCNAMDAGALECGTPEIFNHPDWEPVRIDARAALDAIDWPSFRADADKLVLECRTALFSIGHRERRGSNAKP